jgi:16S rRNA (guanine527-N7)-methyltransferase
MDSNLFVEKMFEAFSNNGMGDLLDRNSADSFYKLYTGLVEKNKTTNVTAITDENGVILKHFVDSAKVCGYIPAGSEVIDIGCGGGFPSLPISILRSDLNVTSLDSTGKKIEIVKELSKELNLKNQVSVCARAEEFASIKREGYDVCVSRAVARLNVLAEICIPLVKVGGLFIAMKSNKGDEEYAEAALGISKLGCELVSIDKVLLAFAGETIEREVYVFKKATKTPPEYPRMYSKILKRPL